MKKTIFAVSFLVVLFAVLSAITLSSVETFLKNEVDVIIDAGHGDPDGGAVASDGTKESDLNLEIANRVYRILTENGINCIMTRYGNDSIYSEGDTIHEKKISDTRNRVKLVNKYPDALLVSVHMNTYQSEEVCGPQVFYKNSNEASKRIAESIQERLNQKYLTSKPKSAKSIPSNVYLFKHIKNNCVLIECGFLTNRTDLENLKKDAFQEDFAKSVSEVIMFNIGD